MGVRTTARATSWSATRPTAIIADAYAFGARNFDTAHALDAMVHEATAPNKDRPGESVRDAKGYLPIDGTYGCCNFYGPVSTQLEYDSADYALASFAKSLGDTADYKKFATRAQDWKNVFNPQTGYLQGKDSDGQFAAGFTPGTSNGFVEGTSAQYTPMVPFNLKELITARGGDGGLRVLPGQPAGQHHRPVGTNANLSNEPSLEIPWEYDYLGQPWKTQAAVREAQQKLYFNAPVGSFGNDDLGAMSSWYVWSALGMYPETPGTDALALGSPVFPVAEVTLGNGKQVTVNAPQAAPDAPYVQALDVKGKECDSVLADLRRSSRRPAPWTTRSAPRRHVVGDLARLASRRRTPPAAGRVLASDRSEQRRADHGARARPATPRCG